MKEYRKLSIPYLVWTVIFIVIPLILIVLYAFTVGGNPVRTLNFTLSNFAKVNEPTYIRVFIKSLELGVLTTAICLFAGYPLAYIMARASERVCPCEA